MTRHRPLIPLMGAAIVLIVSACSAPGGSGTANGSLEGTSWNVVSLVGAPTIAGARPTMSFGTDGSVAGTSGCNGYNGTFKADGDAIVISPLASTKMACEPERNAQEGAFMTALQAVTTWRLADDGSLELSGASDIRAEPAGIAEGSPGPVDLPGTSWRLRDHNGTAPGIDEPPTITFGADGSVSGTSGCNSYSGTYAVDGATIAFSQMASTMMACPDAEMAVESMYLTSLQASTSYGIDAAGNLILTGIDTLTFEPA